MKFLLLVVVLFVLTKQACPPNCSQCSSGGYCTQCYDGFMLSGGRCYQCVTGCSQCPNNINVCTQCSNGYLLSGGKCYPCVTGCSQCPNNINVCTQCFNGYLLSGGKCYPCSDSHCALCPNNVSICTQCFSGYKISAGRCYPAISNFQSEWWNDYRYLYLCSTLFCKLNSFSSQAEDFIIL